MVKMDYNKLCGEVRAHGLTQRQLAKIIGISEGQLSQKMQSNYPFKQSEIRDICDALEINPAHIGSYFFTPAVEKSQLNGSEITKVDLTKEE